MNSNSRTAVPDGDESAYLDFDAELTELLSQA